MMLQSLNNCYFEYIWILQKPGRRRVSREVREQSRLAPELWRKWAQQWWRIESITERISFHRAVFPIEIPLRLIQMYSFFGDLVLDPYMGTGATMIAADYCNRRSVGFEIDANCSDLLRRRVELDAPTLFTGELEYDLVIPERS